MERLEKLRMTVETIKGERSLRDVASEIGIGFSTLGRFLNGHTNLDLKTYFAILDWTLDNGT